MPLKKAFTTQEPFHQNTVTFDPDALFKGVNQIFHESKPSFEPLKMWLCSFAFYLSFVYFLRFTDALMTPLRQLKYQKIYSKSKACHLLVDLCFCYHKI